MRCVRGQLTRVNPGNWYNHPNIKNERSLKKTKNATWPVAFSRSQGLILAANTEVEANVEAQNHTSGEEEFRHSQVYQAVDSKGKRKFVPRDIDELKPKASQRANHSNAEDRPSQAERKAAERDRKQSVQLARDNKGQRGVLLVEPRAISKASEKALAAISSDGPDTEPAKPKPKKPNNKGKGQGRGRGCGR